VIAANVISPANCRNCRIRYLSILTVPGSLTWATYFRYLATKASRYISGSCDKSIEIYIGFFVADGNTFTSFPFNVRQDLVGFFLSGLTLAGRSTDAAALVVPVIDVIIYSGFEFAGVDSHLGQS
jgi:hypothetical protein